MPQAMRRPGARLQQGRGLLRALLVKIVPRITLRLESSLRFGFTPAATSMIVRIASPGHDECVKPSGRSGTKACCFLRLVGLRDEAPVAEDVLLKSPGGRYLRGLRGSNQFSPKASRSIRHRIPQLES
jgi:hypothetical protein